MEGKETLVQIYYMIGEYIFSKKYEYILKKEKELKYLPVCENLENKCLKQKNCKFCG